MPSIPQSLLWISLVVLWLFVLVPMLISKRDTVRRTSDVALATRVLNTGRGARLLRRRSGPAAGHYSDPDWQPSEDLETTTPTTTRGRRTTTRHHGGPSCWPPPRCRPNPTTSTSTSSRWTRAHCRSEPPPQSRSTSSPTPSCHWTTTTARRRSRSRTSPRSTSRPRRSTRPSPSSIAEPEESTDVFESLDDGTDHDYEYVDDSSGLEAPSDADLHVADSISEARRKRYESKTAAAVSARKYKFRKRMLMVMAVLSVATAAAAFLVSPTFWWACGSVGAVTLLYLGYLRRQTRIEEQVRRRRAQRMARSRLGVESTQDPRVRRRAVAAASSRRGGAGDRRRGPDLRAPRLRSVRR